MSIRIVSIRIALLFSLIFNLAIGASIARVMKLSGDVNIQQIGQSDFLVKATPGMTINNGDHLRVGEQGFAVIIYLDDKTVLKVRENSEFQFIDSENTRVVAMQFGTVFNQVATQGRNKTFRVESPVSVASVKGTAFWAVIDPSGIDQFFGTEGLFEVFNQISGQTVNVGPGMKAISNALGNLMNAPANAAELPTDPDVAPAPESTGPETPPETIAPETTPQDIPAPEPTPTEVTPEQAPPTEIPGGDMPEEGTGEAPGGAAGKAFGMGLGIGSVTIDGKIYNQFALRPEFKFGKLGLGFDFVIYIDDQGSVHPDEWDELSDIVDKFLYVRWAEKKDPLWFKIGALDNVTLGYGGLLEGYSNMMEFPNVRRIGLNMGVNIGKVGTEIFLGNMKDITRGGTLFGLRSTYRLSKTFPLTIGANVVADLNQFSGMKDKDGDSYPDMFDDFPNDKKFRVDTDGDGLADRNPLEFDVDGDGVPDRYDSTRVVQFWKDLEAATGGNFEAYYDSIPDRNVLVKPDPFSTADNTSMALGFAVDIGYPIFQNKLLALDLYTELNHLQFPEVAATNSYKGRPARSGTGISIPGIRARILSFLNVSLEYRIKQDYFVPHFFDQSYDLTRATAYYSPADSLVYVRTKDMALFRNEISGTNSKGYYGMASANLLKIASLMASYTSMKADTVQFNSFYAQFNLNTDFVPKLSLASAYYQRNNDQNPFDFKNPSENTILGYKLGYEISSGVSLIWDFRQYYRNNGEKLVPIKVTTIETAFSF